MKAGIWLAPFVAEAKSALFRENPSWFCKDNNGDFIKCGSNWSGFYALNLKNSEVDPMQRMKPVEDSRDLKKLFLKKIK